ncbi:MAG: FAD-dependent oxidoreductase [Candidatus Omnitrophota bacterium]
MTAHTQKKTVVMGAGPAGLTCAYELARQQAQVSVIDEQAEPGGLCRTLRRKSYLFDIGGHRFLTHHPEILALWEKFLGEDLLRVPRSSKILFEGKTFEYPLSFLNALSGLGIPESLTCLLSYFASKRARHIDESNFEGWMVKRFGRRLFQIFFESYTEKVWGIPCASISSDWARQRIQDLTLETMIRRAFLPRKPSGFKTLTREFLYPRLGPGQFFQRLHQETARLGAAFHLQCRVEKIHTGNTGIEGISVRDHEGQEAFIPGDFFFSSIPISEFIRMMEPQAPADIVQASARLHFRSLIAVYLIFNIRDLFPEHWLYIHSPEVKLGRIQNYKNWSPAMVPNFAQTSLGLEYFVDEGDALWKTDNQALLQMGLDELEHLGFKVKKHFVDGFVVRVPNTYPVYGPGYQEILDELRRYMENFKNIQLMGRSGLFRYGNLDSAMMMGLRAARNFLANEKPLWTIEIPESADTPA